MSIALTITTDGRSEYLKLTIDSINTHLTGDITRRILWDDSGDPAQLLWLGKTFIPDGWEIYTTGPERVGHAQTRAELWQTLTHFRHVTHVAGFEDDFTLTHHINLDDLVATLDDNPHLSQVALMRNACYPRELRTPDRILGWPRQRFRQHNRNGHIWYQHRLFWTCNPSVYHIQLCAEGWPVAPSSEVVFAKQQFAKGRWSAFHGHIDDEPAIHHIGLQRAGGFGY